jgi:hypothetical protein
MPVTPEGAPQVVLFCGSRHWTDYASVQADVFDLADGSIVVHGSAPGLDRLADRAALLCASVKNLHVVRVPALWDAYGNRAGPRRNAAMLRACRIDFAFCYPLSESRGTRDMMRRLKAAGIPHVVREPI